MTGHALRIAWAGEGNLRAIQALLDAHGEAVDVVAARRLSPAARDRLADAGVGWADQSGAAKIAVGGILVSREGRPPEPWPKQHLNAPHAVGKAVGRLLVPAG